jgi:hypothetical protein
MEASGVRPGPDPFLRAEIVHSSERTRITRLFLPGRTVIRKEPLGPDAERRVRHEVAMLERLFGVAGVAQLAQAPGYPGSVVLEDAGGASLAGMAEPLPAGELAGLGLGLAPETATAPEAPRPRRLDPFGQLLVIALLWQALPRISCKACVEARRRRHRRRGN